MTKKDIDISNLSGAIFAPKSEDTDLDKIKKSVDDIEREIRSLECEVSAANRMASIALSLSMALAVTLVAFSVMSVLRGVI